MTDGTHPLARDLSALGRLLGIRVTHAAPDRIEAEMVAAPDLLNRNGMLHGGAIMALADILGGTGTFVNLSPGQGTTTLESKTNFLRPIPPGDRVRAVSVPLHRGRRTMVWQTEIRRGDGKTAAIVTQTQMVLPG